MESNVQVDKKPTKRGKKHAAEAEGTLPGATATPAVEGEEKAKRTGSNAARPRKYNYGITPEATVRRANEGPVTVRKDIEKSWEATDGEPTVAEYMERGGDRHGLRVLMRRGLIKLIGTDGAEYPVAFSSGATAEEAPAAEVAAEA